MTSLEVKLSISGPELLALKKLAGTEDDLIRLRSTARTIIKTTLANAASALEACLEGRIGDLELSDSNNNEEQRKL